jgi:predicted MPP superfamily phosphohydrolase
MKNTDRRFVTRRSFLRLGGLGLAGAGGFGIAKWEAERLETTFKAIDGLGVSEKIRVLHLSDLHASACVSWELINESIERGLAENPDLVVLTGDYVTGRGQDLSGYRKALAPLHGHPHCFAVFGNHDGSYRVGDESLVTTRLERIFSEVGIRFLVNRSVTEEIRGTPLKIAGVGDLWRGPVFPENCLTPIRHDKGPLTLLLAHNPDTKDLLRGHHWDVMFCGHTHGGQVVVPFFNWAPHLPVQDRSMVAGIYPWDGRHIHITRGVGNLHGIRFACRPEVSLIDLT